MEENNSILVDLCAQSYFKEIFAKLNKILAFASPSLNIIWANDSFNALIGNTSTLSGIIPNTQSTEAQIQHLTSGDTSGSLLFFPIVFQNHFLGYLVLFTQERNSDDSFALKAAKHDINNLLTIVFNMVTVKSNNSLLNEGLDITKDFLSTFSFNDSSTEALNIIKTLNMVFNSFSGSSSGSVVFRADISPDLHKVRANKTKFIRVISNLLTNALESIPTSGNIILSAFNWRNNDKDFICVSIEDTGIGIPEKDLNGIFTNDFSTKKRGSGIGLSIVKKLADEMNGLIEVQSKVNSGSIFTFKLPALAGDKKIIALIEDEAIINELLTDLLSTTYSVFSYLDAESFLANNHIINIDLVIVDKKLPGISGIECIKHIRKLNNKIKIILASGSETEEDNNLAGLAINSFVNKPYKFDQLLSVVEELLA